MARRVVKAERYTMFTKTKPWGYDPEEVETFVNKLKDTILQLNALCDSQKVEMAKKDAENERLQAEVTSMYYQLASVEVPPIESSQESALLQEFSTFNIPEGKSQQAHKLINFKEEKDSKPTKTSTEPALAENYDDSDDSSGESSIAFQILGD